MGDSIIEDLSLPEQFVQNYTIEWILDVTFDNTNFLILGICVALFLALLVVVLLAICKTQESELVKLRLKIHIQLIAAHILVYLVVIATPKLSPQQNPCVLLGSLVEYGILVVYMILGLHILIAIIASKNMKHRAHIYAGLVWGLPAVPIGVILGIHYGSENKLLDTEKCWFIESTDGLLGQISPPSILLLLNLLLILASRQVKSLKKIREVHLIAKISWMNVVLLSLPFLGYYILHYMWSREDNYLLEYIVTAILVIQCLMVGICLLFLEHTVKNSLVGYAKEYYAYLQEIPKAKKSGIMYIP